MVNDTETTTGTWPIEVDRIGVKLPLIECLRILAAHYGRRASLQSLIGGLPISKTGITPSIFIRASERAELHSRVVEKNLAALLIQQQFPFVAVLKNQQACIVWGVEYAGGVKPASKVGIEPVLSNETKVIIQSPETETEKTTVSFNDVNLQYGGYAFYTRPMARHDNRAGPATIDTTRDWFWGVLKENKRLYHEVIIGAVMLNLFAIASSLFTMNIYDRVVPNNAIETLMALSIGIFVVFIFEFIIKNIRAHFLDVAGRRADVKISASLFEQIMGMTMRARPKSAGILASNMRDFETIRDFFTSASLTALIDLPFLFVFIILIAIIAGPLALVPLAGVPIVLAAGWYMQKPLQKIVRQSMNESAIKNALLFETISGLETIKSQAAEGHIQRRWEELTDKASRTSMKLRRISSFTLNFSSFIQQLIGVLVVIVGVYMIWGGSITMGALIASVMLASRAMTPLSTIAALLARLSQSREALHQLTDLMQKEVERPKQKHFIPKREFDGRIEFQNVIFHYPGQTIPALNQVSLNIEAGTRVGIIGAVGSGKTTIERLLLNLYQPDSGSIMIDGVDVRQIDPSDLRRNIGTIQQTPYLFYGSVRENITMGNENTTDSALLRAAEISGTLEFLRDTHAGLDTQIGERGEALSGGQKQAIEIARALLHDPSILIMDEPTSSMDPASEARLLKRLDEISKGKTTLLITHKGVMLSMVEKIILMDRGRIVAYGPKDEILAKLQTKQFDTPPQAGGQ